MSTTDVHGFVSVSDAPTSSAPTAAAAAASSSTSSSTASQVVDMFKRSSHPTTALFHVAFKLAALLIYLLNGMIGLSQVQLFVVVIVLMAFDFWVVKNVSGRLMVGLRWWNESSAEDGSSVWRYESIEDQSQVSAVDYTLFWYPMYLAGALWGLFAVWAVLKLDLESALLAGVSVGLVWSNVYGYWNCSAQARTQLQNAVQSSVQQGVVAALTSKWFSSGGGAATAAKTADVV